MLIFFKKKCKFATSNVHFSVYYHLFLYTPSCKFLNFKPNINNKKLMKKISTLLMLFCAFVGMAWAGPTDLPTITTDVENPVYYTIYNTRSSQPGGLMYYAGDAVGLKDGCTALSLEDKYKFFFTGTHDAMYIHNAATGKKLASVDSWTEEGTEWAIGVSPKGNGLAIGPKGGLDGNGCINEKNFETDATTSDFTTYSANDDGSVFVAELAANYVFPEAGKFYVIEAPLFFNVQGVNKGLIVNADGSLGWNTIDLTNKNCYWQIEIKDGAVALKNVGTGKYLNGTAMTDAAVYGTIKCLGSNQFNIVVNSTTVHANGHGGGNNASGNIVNYGGAIGSASAWSFVEKADPNAVQEVTVKYSFTYNGETKATQEVKTLVGEKWPAVTLPYGVSGDQPEGVIAASDVVEGVAAKTIEVAYNLPFVAAADNKSITKWYYIQMHSNSAYTKYLQSAEGYIEWADASVDANEIDSYTWAFVGDPFDGYKMVNYAAGTDKAVNADPVTDPNNKVIPSVGDFATATKWQIKSSSTNKEAQYFCFQYPNSDQYMNAQNGKVQYWSSADNGSTMWVTERDLSGATELQAVIDQVEAFVAAGVNAATTVGYITAESVAAVSEALAAAKKAVEDKAGCIAAQADLQAAVAAVKTIQPEEGKFYVIASAMPETDGRSGQKMYVNNDGNMQFQTEDAFANVFQFVNAGEGKFYLLSVENGAYLNTAVGHAGGQLSANAFETSEAKSLTIANMGRANVVSLIPEGGAMMHAQASGSSVVGWNNTDNAGASAWTIQEVKIEDYAHTVNVAGWATLYLGFNATIPADVKAFVVSEIGDDAKLTEVVGVLPKNEAVLLYAANGAYDFCYTDETPATINTNLLKGTVYNTNIAENAYVLGNTDGVVAFYTATLDVNTDTSNDETVTEGEESTTIPTYEAFKNNAFEAYLPKPENASDVLYINFNDVTAIKSILSGFETNAPIYDLSGRRVMNAVKGGIYIQNGKKFIVK